MDGEWGERDVYDSQCGHRMIFSRSEVVDDGGVELVRVGKVKIEAAVMPELFGAQGALVEAACRME